MNNRYLPVTALAMLFACTHSPLVAAATRAQSCAAYAGKAFEQNLWNKQVQCNYTGSRWSNDTVGQKKWCMGVRPQITDAETAARKQLLDQCYENKLYQPNLNNIYGSPQSPSACRWNREGYQPVSHLLTRRNYNLKPEAVAPISTKNGRIEKDYNGDGKLDYLFMERSPQGGRKYRTVLCMSGTSGWKRAELYEMKEDIDPHFAVEVQNFNQTANGFSYSQGSSEHNLGGRDTTWTYSYSKQHRSFLLDSVKSSSYSGDGQSPETSDISDFVKGERRQTVNCSGMASWARVGCKPLDNAITPMKKSEYTIKARKRRF